MGNFKQSYVIKIQYGALDGSDVGSAPDTGSESGKARADEKQEPSISPVQIVTPFISTAMQMRTQEVSTVTGSGQLARKQALTNALISTGVAVTSKVVGGAGIASALGVAAGPAAIVAAAMTAVTKVLDIAASAAEIRNKMEVESTAISATKARAGISWDRSRER